MANSFFVTLVISPVLMSLVACASGTQSPPYTSSSSGESSGSSSGGGSSGSGSGSSSSGGTSSGSPSGSGSGSSGTSSGGPATSLPLTVSANFVPSGFMGDGMTAGSIVMVPLTPADPTDCNGDRSSPAIGTCYTFTYTPVTGGLGWGGVYWQYPSNNWGNMPGLDVAPGATKVTFWAKGAAGGEVLEVVAGGIGQGATPAPMYSDPMKADQKFTLTSSWAQYSLPLPTMNYSPVLGGLAWAMGTATITGGSAGFKIDSMQWVQ